MNKSEEAKLLNRVAILEKQVAELFEKLENNMINKHSYTVRETAKILGVTPKTVYNMIDKGQLDTVELGHTRVLGNSLRDKLGA